VAGLRVTSPSGTGYSTVCNIVKWAGGPPCPPPLNCKRLLSLELRRLIRTTGHRTPANPNSSSRTPAIGLLHYVTLFPDCPRAVGKQHGSNSNIMFSGRSKVPLDLATTRPCVRANFTSIMEEDQSMRLKDSYGSASRSTNQRECYCVPAA
jgi:hypothetical protein